MTYLTISSHLEQPRRLSVTGEIDLASAEEFRAALAPHCEEKIDLILDFDGVAFLDSRGISALVATSVSLSPGRLIVHDARPGIRKTLEIVGLSALCD